MRGRRDGHGHDRRGHLRHSPAAAGRVRIRADALTAIKAHAERELPNECCGLLVGAADSIDEAVPARNVLEHPGRYEIDPRDHIALNRRLRGTGRAVVGVYHSHPLAPAIPSPRDLAEAHYPEFVWLIVSLQAGKEDCRMYRIAGNEAVELGWTAVERLESGA